MFDKDIKKNTKVHNVAEQIKPPENQQPRKSNKYQVFRTGHVKNKGKINYHKKLHHQ